MLEAEVLLAETLGRCLLLVLGMGCGSAKAQYGLYAMGSGGYLGSVNASQGSLVVSQDSVSAYGGTFGFYDTLLRAGPLQLGGDARYVIEVQRRQHAGMGTRFGAG